MKTGWMPGPNHPDYSAAVEYGPAPCPPAPPRPRSAYRKPARIVCSQCGAEKPHGQSVRPCGAFQKSTTSTGDVLPGTGDDSTFCEAKNLVRSSGRTDPDLHSGPASRRDYTELGYRVGAARLGIDPCEYRAKREAGLRWCGHHGDWHPETQFRFYSNLRYPWRSNCAEGERVLARESQRRYREAARRRAAMFEGMAL